MTATTHPAPAAGPRFQFVPFADLTNWSVRFALETRFHYNPAYPLRSLGSFLRRVKDEVTIQDQTTYQRVTVRVNNRGVVPRDTAIGRSIGTKRQFRVMPGQFLLSRIDARHGATGLVPPVLAGAVVTADFLAFEIDQAQVNSDFLVLITSTQEFIRFCQSCSSGTTNRQRLDAQLFLDVKIPLPSLPEQARLVADYHAKTQQAQQQRAEATASLERHKQALDAFFGISKKESIQKPADSKFYFVDFKNLEKWGIDFSGIKGMWQVRPVFPQWQINALCTVGSGGTPSRTNPAYYKNGTIPWVKTTEVVNSIITSTEEHITPAALAGSSARLYEAGSLIIAMYGQGATRGRTAKLGIQAATNQACAVLSNINNEIILTDFLWLHLVNEYDRLREMASGNNQPNLNAAMIQTFKIQVPDLQTQREQIEIYFAAKAGAEDLRAAADALEAAAVAEFEAEVFQAK